MQRCSVRRVLDARGHVGADTDQEQHRLHISRQNGWVQEVPPLGVKLLVYETKI